MTEKQDMNIQWYPGHMTKTRRQLEQDISQVDAVCELLDARIPRASRNPDIDALAGRKPRVIILNRMDLADPQATSAWQRHFAEGGFAALAVDCKSRKGVSRFAPAVREACREKLLRDASRGMTRPLRVMVVGIPNVGKSTFINQVAGRRGARAENRPGVTRGKQWVNVDSGLLLMDTPGILWPKFEDPSVGAYLAFTGAVKEDILDTETLACKLLELLLRRYPAALAERYRISAPPDTPGYALLEEAGRSRGFLLSGGRVDTQRMARAALDEFRAGKLGRITLERPEEGTQ